MFVTRTRPALLTPVNKSRACSDAFVAGPFALAMGRHFLRDFKKPSVRPGSAGVHGELSNGGLISRREAAVLVPPLHRRLAHVEPLGERRLREAEDDAPD